MFYVLWYYVPGIYIATSQERSHQYREGRDEDDVGNTREKTIATPEHRGMASKLIDSWGKGVKAM